MNKIPTGDYYDKDCRGGHHINWVRSSGRLQYFKCSRCGVEFVKPHERYELIVQMKRATTMNPPIC